MLSLRYSFAAVITALSLLAALPSCALPRPDAPDTAAPFLHTPAHSVDDLVREVRRDTAARARYAAFFQIAPEETVAYLKRRLTPGVIPATAPYTVYYLSHKGTVYPVWLTLPAGTRVFYNPRRVPVLLCNSGDPLMLPLWATHPALPMHKATQMTKAAQAADEVPVTASVSSAH